MALLAALDRPDRQLLGWTLPASAGCCHLPLACVCHLLAGQGKPSRTLDGSIKSLTLEVNAYL
jgi:hypothetical protein